MHIGREERMSRARGAPQGYQRWGKTSGSGWRSGLRYLAYGLLALVGAAATLTVAGLVTHRTPETRPSLAQLPSGPTPDAQPQSSPQGSAVRPPARVEAPIPAPPAPAAGATLQPAPMPAPAATQPAATTAPATPQPSAIEAQLREEAASLAALREATAKVRSELADLNRERLASQVAPAPPPPAAAPTAPPRPTAAAVPAPQPAAQIEPQHADEATAAVPTHVLDSTLARLAREYPVADNGGNNAAAAPAAAAPRPASRPAPTPQAQEQSQAGADLRRESLPALRSPPPGLLGTLPLADVPPPQPAPQQQPSQQQLAAVAPVPLPAPLRPTTRPTVHIAFRAGSPAAESLATDIAHRLLFSDFAYTEMHPSTGTGIGSAVIYYWPEDADSATILAAQLRATGAVFGVQGLVSSQTRPPRGTLEVVVDR